MIGILGIGIYVLYYRNKNKEKYKEDSFANIMFLNEYINNSLNNPLDKSIDNSLINELDDSDIKLK